MIITFLVSTLTEKASSFHPSLFKADNEKPVLKPSLRQQKGVDTKHNELVFLILEKIKSIFQKKLVPWGTDGRSTSLEWRFSILDR